MAWWRPWPWIVLGQVDYLATPVGAQVPTSQTTQITNFPGASFAPDGAFQASISDDGTRVAYTAFPFFKVIVFDSGDGLLRPISGTVSLDASISSGGKLDDARCYTRILTPEEIDELAKLE